jgi:hypothetical protein
MADTASLFRSMGDPPVTGPDDTLPHARKALLGIE